MNERLLEHALRAPSGQVALLNEWTGPYGGVPPFDAVTIGVFESTLQTAMAEQLAEIEGIAASTEPPDFANTMEALERSGRSLDRAVAMYEVWRTNMSSVEFRAVELRMAPRLAAFADVITQNEALFRRIETIHDSPEPGHLTAEQQRLVWLCYTNFVRAGAKLGVADKARLSAINQRLATLFAEFNQNVLADEDEQWLTLDHASDLHGLPAAFVEAAAAAAEEKGLSGKWVIANTRSSMEPFLVHARRRDLRERAWRMWTRRGDGGDHDNHPVIEEILGLRAERATLLGYATHAHWRLENTMARTPERALDLLLEVWPLALGRVRREVADMQALAAEEGDDIQIEPWDYRYYAERVRAVHYEIDQNRIKEYLQLDYVRDSMFWVARELFGLDFQEVGDVPVFHPDVRVWEVTSRRNGAHIGLWYFDPFARQGKKSGAWMMDYRRQESFDRSITTLVSNNCNYVRGRRGDPVLISWDDATTLFHEFGHALHGLCSAVTYPSLSGTAVPPDFVEFPSQLLEHWLSTPDVLQRFAVHHETGEPIPPWIVERIERAATFNQGFATTEYLASALIDLKLHLAAPDAIDVQDFEHDTLAELGMPREVAVRHRMPHFQHVFGSDGYSAGYYSYLWADALVADAFESFMEAGGPFDAEVAERLRAEVLSTGNTADPADMYRRFRGRDAGTEALMRKRGFV
ncbi:M3 family metallopeptidase [soil metagenome]